MPDDGETAAISESVQRRAKRRRPVKVKVEGEDGTFVAGSPHGDVAGHVARLSDAFGTRSTDFIGTQLAALEHASRDRGKRRSAENGGGGINSALAIVEAVRPENELEAALAVQMAQGHFVSTEMMGRAKNSESVEHTRIYVELATKLQRTFVAQIEALAKMRGKGQQTVRVEHVTVQPGAQAIVGDVHHHAVENQRISNDAPALPAVGRAALPSPDPLGNGVPLALDAERPLPDARRSVDRPAARKSERAQARRLHEGGEE